MIDWIRNIVPRIRNYSTDLNKIETLVDKTWIWHEFQEGHSTFHFLRDGRLLITRSGDVEEGIWELIPGGLLHIKGNHFNYMFNHGIVFEGVLLIKKQGVADSLEIFYDEAEIPNGDVLVYIEKFLKEIYELSDTDKYIAVDSNNANQLYNEYKLINYEGRELFIHDSPKIGEQVKEKDGDSIFSVNFLKITNSVACDLELGIIIRLYDYTLLNTENGKILLKIDNFNWENPKGTAEFIDNSFIVNGIFNLSNSMYQDRMISINNGIIEKMITKNNSRYMIIFLVTICLLLAVIISFMNR